MEYYNSGMQHISDHLLNAVMPEQREALSATLKVIMLTCQEEWRRT